MPYYSELGIYTPNTSYTSPFLKGPYSGHSSIIASNILPPSTFRGNNFRGFKPHLTTISESNIGGVPIRRINSPKVIYHSSPQVRTPRPVKINTSDIDVSFNRYNNNRKCDQLTHKNSAQESPRSKKEASPVIEKEAKPNKQIRRDRATIRLQTIHKDTLEKEIGQLKTWRDNFKPEELTVEEKRHKKTPGEILKEKFLIRSKSKENVIDPVTISRKNSVSKSPSFKDICNVITSDQTVEDLNPFQPIEVRRRQSRQFSHDEILKEIQRSSSTLSVEEVQILDALLQAEAEVGLFNEPTVIEEKPKTKKKKVVKKKSADKLDNIESKIEDNDKNLKQSFTKNNSQDNIPHTRLRKDSSLVDMVKDISQVEIEMIPVKQKPVIKGYIGSIEEKSKSTLKAIVDDLEIQESPKPQKKEKKFRFNVTVQEFPVKKIINFPKLELENKNFGTEQIPCTKKPVENIILKKQEKSVKSIVEEAKPLIKKKIIKSLSDNKVIKKEDHLSLKKSSSDNMVHNFTVTVDKIKNDENSQEKDTRPSNKLRIIGVQNNIEKNYTNIPKIKEVKNKEESLNFEKFAKKDVKLLENNKIESKVVANDVMNKESKKLNEQNVTTVKDSKFEKQGSDKSDPSLKSFEKDLINKKSNEDNNKQINKNAKVLTKSLPVELILDKESFYKPTKDLITKNDIQKEEFDLWEKQNDKKCETPKEQKTLPTQTKLGLSDLEIKENKKDGTNQRKELKKLELKTKVNEKLPKSKDKSEEAVNNKNEINFWAIHEEEEEENHKPQILTKLKLTQDDPKPPSKEPETPEEKQKRIISKRSLIQKANKNDPDLRVFDPPTPPINVEPVKSPSPEPSFIPLQSNRLSQLVFTGKPKKERPIEIYAKPKFIRARHIPRRWQENSDSEDSTTTEEEGSTSEDEECEVANQTGDVQNKIGASTSSDDSGFDSGKNKNKECDVNCHKKCEKLMANLCGINEKLVAEAIENVRKDSTDSRDRDSSANTINPASNPAFALDFNDLPEEVSQSKTYQSFQKSGRITPPATTIPRFKKYCVDDFNFLKVLGKGSFGKVLLAELKGTEYYYAIKCLKKDVVLEDDDVECTLIERKVLALGTKHPYLCHLLCTFQTESHLFFVMEYLNGGDLMFHIQAERRFSEARARFYGAEIVSGLKFLHNKGIVYRDLKLDNILLDFDGHVRIADFGMCKLQIFLDRMADTFCGTPDYMAPEIIKGQHYNQCVDWWSFGVLLYEMLLGQSPFSGSDEDELFWSICNEKPVIPRFLSAESGSVLLQFLEKDANKRLGNRFSPHGDIQDHIFFKPIDWAALEARQLEPPFKPNLQHPLDTQYFDKTFTVEKAKLTPIETGILQSIDQTQFQGFSYTNPNATDK